MNTTATLRSVTSAPSRVTASTAAKSPASVWTLMSRALEMARLVGESGPVSAQRLKHIKALAASL